MNIKYCNYCGGEVKVVAKQDDIEKRKCKMCGTMFISKKINKSRIKVDIILPKNKTEYFV